MLALTKYSVDQVLKAMDMGRGQQPKGQKVSNEFKSNNSGGLK